MADIRKWRKRISYFLFALAIAYFSPPAFFGEIFSDLFLNLPTATFISKKLGFSLMGSLLLTYLAVPILLIWAGSIIYPADTTKTFNGQFTKFKNFFIKYINLIKRNPVHLIWIFLSLVILFRILSFYSARINIYVLS